MPEGLTVEVFFGFLLLMNLAIFYFLTFKHKPIFNRISGSSVTISPPNKVVVAMHKYEHPKDNYWFDLWYKLCCY